MQNPFRYFNSSLEVIRLAVDPELAGRFPSAQTLMMTH
jgi:hypothetical protein